MMSCALGRSDIGRNCASNESAVTPNGSTSVAQIWGVSDDVAQVSMTSGSGTNQSSPDEPHDGQASTGGGVSCGSTGSISADAVTTWLHARQYHAGKATP